MPDKQLRGVMPCRACIGVLTSAGYPPSACLLGNKMQPGIRNDLPAPTGCAAAGLHDPSRMGCSPVLPQPDLLADLPCFLDQGLQKAPPRLLPHLHAGCGGEQAAPAPAPSWHIQEAKCGG